MGGFRHPWSSEFSSALHGWPRPVSVGEGQIEALILAVMKNPFGSEMDRES